MRKLSLKCGFEIPALGQGTWLMGGRTEPDPNNDDAAQIAALQRGIASGLNLIDTAEYYAKGYAETLVGQAIAGVPRKTLFLTSKVWKTHLDHDGVWRACEASLRRLGTSYLDLYLYHQVSDAVPLEETIGALNELVEQGLVRHIGVSNFAPARLARAQAVSTAPIVLNQVHYSLKFREPERLNLLQFCREHEVIVQAWRPVRGVAASELTDQLGQKYGLTLPQLALSFLLSQPGVGTICASNNPAHLAANQAALACRLAPDDLELLRRCYPDQVAISTVPLS